MRFILRLIGIAATLTSAGCGGGPPPSAPADPSAASPPPSRGSAPSSSATGEAASASAEPPAPETSRAPSEDAPSPPFPPHERSDYVALVDDPAFLDDVAGYIVDEECPNAMLAKTEGKTVPELSVAGYGDEFMVTIQGPDTKTFGKLYAWTEPRIPPGKRLLFGQMFFNGKEYGWRALCVDTDPVIRPGELEVVEALRSKGLIVAIASAGMERANARTPGALRLAFGKAGYHLLTPTRLPLKQGQGIVLFAK
ncbi:MAG: hypothetical protein R3B89_09725 [Polyangiaceae bacterium]